MMEKAYKVFTRSLCSPIQGGPPVWDGTLPYDLPRVEVDTGGQECAAGWNACREAHTALRIAGLWPDGRPSRLFAVETDETVVERGDKVRAATWTVTEEVADVAPHIEALTREVFRAGDLTVGLVREQMAWREALGRPRRDERRVVEGLTRALRHRGLAWELRKHDTARAAWATWAAWAAWDARAARAAWAAWDARAARAAWAAWAAWDAWAARAAWATWDAWDARAACMVWQAAKLGVIDHRADLLTVGLRTAYRHGLGVALPVAPGVLGWAMDAPDSEGGE